MSIVEKITEIFSSPTQFFLSLKEDGVGEAFGYLAVVGILYAALVGLLYTIMGTMMSIFGMGMGMFASIGSLLLILILYILILVFSFVGAAIAHVWAKIWGGSGNYSHTYQLIVYSSTPNMILGWIPFIGWLAGIYSLVLLIIGTQHMHELSLAKSIIMWIVLGVVLGLLAMILVFVGIASTLFLAGAAVGS
ncbi:MAG: YIP1 family protein [Nanoarchaeota archaeon]